jgi:hypothetical protein
VRNRTICRRCTRTRTQTPSGRWSSIPGATNPARRHIARSSSGAPRLATPAPSGACRSLTARRRRLRRCSVDAPFGFADVGEPTRPTGYPPYPPPRLRRQTQAGSPSASRNPTSAVSYSYVYYSDLARPIIRRQPLAASGVSAAADETLRWALNPHRPSMGDGT